MRPRAPWRGRPRSRITWTRSSPAVRRTRTGDLFVPVSSMEEGSATIPTYQCCTFRGSVVAIDATTGKQIWKTFTIPEAPQPTTRSSRGTQLLWAIRRRRMVHAGAGSRPQPPLRRHRRRLFASRGAHHRRHHGAGDGHRPHPVGAPGAGRRRLDDGVFRRRQRPARTTVPRRLGRTTTSAARPRWSRCAMAAAWWWPGRSRASCTP